MQVGRNICTQGILRKSGCSCTTKEKDKLTDEKLISSCLSKNTGTTVVNALTSIHRKNNRKTDGRQRIVEATVDEYKIYRIQQSGQGIV